MSVSLPCVGQMVHSFFHVFTFALVVEKAWKTTYPPMDSPVHRKLNGVIASW